MSSLSKIKSNNRWIVAALIFLLSVVGYFAFDRFGSGPGDDGPVAAAVSSVSDSSDPAAPGAVDQGGLIDQSIAVLPFADRSARATDSAILTDGFHDDLLTALAAIPELNVISRDSVAGYRQTAKSTRQIGVELDVGAVLQGVLQRTGERMQIEVHLIDTRTDEPLWSETYDREISVESIFDIQWEMIRAIVGKMGADAGPETKPAVPTANFDAYLAVLMSRQVLDRGVDEFSAAAEQARRAIAIDPDYADAHLALAGALIGGLQFGLVSLDEVEPEISDAIHIAMALQPDHDRTWTTLGNYQAALGQAAAARSFETAVQLNPGNVHALFAWGSLLRMIGKPEQALPPLLRASELDPLSPSVLFRLAGTYDVLGQPAEAREQYARIRAIDPASTLGYAPVSGTYVTEGQIDLALAWLDQGQAHNPQDFELAGWLIFLYDSLEDYAAAELWSAWLDNWVTNQPLPMASQAIHHYQKGDFDTAVQYSNLALRLGMADRWGSDAIFMRIKRDEALASGNPESGIEVFRSQHPALFENPPAVNAANLQQAVDLSLLLKLAERREELDRLLGAAIEFYDRPYAVSGSARADLVSAKAEALAIRDDEAAALVELRRIVDRGWRLHWRWETELNFNFNGIRESQDFEAIVIDLQSDMAFQRANVEAMTARGDISPPPRQ